MPVGEFKLQLQQLSEYHVTRYALMTCHISVFPHSVDAAHYSGIDAAPELVKLFSFFPTESQILCYAFHCLPLWVEKVLNTNTFMDASAVLS